MKTREQILALASRPDGLRVADLEGDTESVHSAGSKVSRMIAASLLFKATLSYRNVRYFSTPEAAMACERTNPQAFSFVNRTKSKAWAADAPMHFPRDAKGKPLWKYTVAAKPPETLYRTGTHNVYA